MIDININSGVVIGKLNDAESKQVPRALRLALNRTAEAVKLAEEREMRDVFDRPTPYTMGALFVRYAKKTALESSVEVKDRAVKAIPASKFLRPQIHGGTRKLRRFERAIKHVGVLPIGYAVVPGEAADLDQYGNISRGQIVQILSFFKAFPEVGYSAKMSDRRRATLARGNKKRYGVIYFSVQHGDANTRHRNMLPGIWKREIHGFGSRVRPVFIFVKRTSYEPIFDFGYVAEKTIKKELQPQFDRAFIEAMATAR